MAAKKNGRLESFKPLVEIDVMKEDFVHAGEGSSQIKTRLLKLGYSPQVIRRVAIASYEAELNIVIHSLGGRLKAAIAPQKIRIIAEDDGPGIENIEKAMEKGYSTAPPHIQQMGFGAGMGLANMKNCCDDFKIDSVRGGKTVVTMTIKDEELGTRQDG